MKELIFSNNLEKQDKMLLNRIYDKYIESVEADKVTSTIFLNKFELQIVKENLLNKIDGYIIFKDEFERCTILFNLENLIEICKYVSCLLISNLGSDGISHRDVLGSLMSLGIKREMIGDIYISNDKIYVYIKKEVEQYILENLSLIKRNRIRIEQFDVNVKVNNDAIGKEVNILVPSLRLDNILSEVLRLSRSKTEEILDSHIVYINYKDCDKKDKKVCIGDVITIRGKGRITIVSDEGINKKGKNILKVILNF